MQGTLQRTLFNVSAKSISGKTHKPSGNAYLSIQVVKRSPQFSSFRRPQLFLCLTLQSPTLQQKTPACEMISGTRSISQSRYPLFVLRHTTPWSPTWSPISRSLLTRATIAIHSSSTERADIRCLSEITPLFRKYDYRLASQVVRSPQLRYYNSKCDDCHSCHNCSNCDNCNNCTDCSNGDDLSNCSNCSNCDDCKDCSNCGNCDYCINCTNCTNCDHCLDCENCTNCDSCTDCVNCVGLTNATGVRNVRGEDHDYR